MSLPDPLLSRAVLIGTGEYQDERLPALPSVPNNVSDLATVLTDPAQWGLARDHCRQIIDPDAAAEVLAALVQMADEARDTLVVYFAGHGLITSEGDLVLATRGTVPDLAQYTGVPYEWVRNVINRCQVTRRLIILDCCFSGRALQAMSDTATAVIGQIDVEGTYVLTSAPANSTSVAPEGNRNTAFTAGLLHVLEHGVPDAAEFLSLDDVYEQTLRALTRIGRPRPQRLGTNTIGRLPLVRNAAWRTEFLPRPLTHPSRLPGPAQDDDLGAGIRAAVAAVAPTLGPTGQDSMRAIRRSRGQHRAGVELVAEAMTAMREQYGDGAGTVAVIIGALVDRVGSALAAGANPEALSIGVERVADRMRRRLGGGVERAASEREVARAAAIAVGDDEIVGMVVNAAIEVGASNVEVVADDRPDPQVSFTGSLTFNTRTVAPNAFAGPITLDQPCVVVSLDGLIDTRELLGAIGGVRAPLLIVTPGLGVVTLRSLLHTFSETVVVRPVDPGYDLGALQAQVTGFAGTSCSWGRVGRALVSNSSTTLIGLAAAPQPLRGRMTVRVGGSDQVDRMALAVRTLAVARSVADAGVVVGGGVALFWAAREPVGLDEGMTDAVRAALTEPLNQIARNGGRSPDKVCAQLLQAADPTLGFDVASGEVTTTAAADVLDSLATVRGALGHAVATVSCYLTQL